MDAHVRGYVGEQVKLKCIFKSTSSVTDKLTIDWTYRPPSSSRTESVSVCLKVSSASSMVSSSGVLSCPTRDTPEALSRFCGDEPLPNLAFVGSCWAFRAERRAGLQTSCRKKSCQGLRGNVIGFCFPFVVSFCVFGSHVLRNGTFRTAG